MGLRFEASDPRQLVTLRRWLGEISGEPLTETEIPEKEEKKDSPRRATEQALVLSDLVTELIRKGILAEAVGKEMLQRLASAA